jgi:hypothetical protein
MTSYPRLTVLLAFTVAYAMATFAQQKPPVCNQNTYAAFKPLPKLEYTCPGGVADYDDAILKLPERIAANRKVEIALANLTDPLWWRSNVDELNACNIHGAAGKLTDEESRKWGDGEYDFELTGDHEVRLAIISDPCYQKEYSGSSVFLLYHKNGKTFVSKVINGYFSRVANSVGVDFANENGQLIIEVSTANSFPPSLTSYFFEIDPATNLAHPKNLFMERAKLTNKIYSDMLMGEPKDMGLPDDAGELNIIRNHRLAASFSAYLQDEHGKIDDRLRRIIYHWNGRYYTVSPLRRAERG